MRADAFGMMINLAEAAFNIPIRNDLAPSSRGAIDSDMPGTFQSDAGVHLIRCYQIVEGKVLSLGAKGERLWRMNGPSFIIIGELNVRMRSYWRKSHSLTVQAASKWSTRKKTLG